MNLFKKENYLIFTCVGIMVLGGIALKTEFSFLNFNSKNTKKSKLATVAQVNSDARIRNSQNMFWQTIDEKDLVAQGDSLFVGPKSSVVLTFNDGKTVTINENSLIKFQTENSKVKLSLQYGKIKTQDLPQNLVLDDCGQEININSTSKAAVEIGKSNNCGRLEVKSTQGEVKVNNAIIKKSDSPIQIFKTKTVKFTEKPKVNEAMVKVEQLKISQFSFEDNTDATTKAQQELEAELARKKAEELLLAEKAAEALRIQAEKEKQAQEEEKRKKEEAEKLAAQQLEENRILNIIKNLKPPVLLKPKMSYFISNQKPPNADWLPAENAIEYLIEFADNIQFLNSQSTKTSLLSFKLDFTTDKSLYYRVKTIGPRNSQSEFSRIGFIEGLFDKIKFNQNEIKLTFYPKTSREPASLHQVPISWSKVKSASKYKIKYSSDEQFKSFDTIEVLEENAIIPITQEGQYWVMAEALNKKNELISNSESPAKIELVKEFDLTTPTISKYNKSLTYYFQQSEARYIWLKWNEIKSKKPIRYKVELSIDKDFKSITKSFVTQSNKFLLKNDISNGKYFWRIRTESISTQNPQFSDWSELAQLQITSTK